MKFLAMLCDVEAEQLKPGDPGFAERMAAYAAFTKKAETLGAFRTAGKLQPTKAARTVRIRRGKTLVTDGPFAETREQLGGFYLLECKDMDEALELAAQIPTAETGSVEVRPLFG